MKTPKTYRFSPSTLSDLDAMKSAFAAWGKNWTETEIVEYAISQLYRRYRNDILDLQEQQGAGN